MLQNHPKNSFVERPLVLISQICKGDFFFFSETISVNIMTQVLKCVKIKTIIWLHNTLNNVCELFELFSRYFCVYDNVVFHKKKKKS